MIKKTFKEDIRVQDRVRLRTRRPGGGGGDSRSGGGGGAPPIQMESNVFLKMIDPETDKVVEERESHNIFVNYGRDWIAHLTALATTGPDTFEREDRIRYMAVGIGGQSQLIDYTTLHGTYPGYAQDWGGVGGATPPLQTDTDPTVVGLEWPVLVNNLGEYYDDISAPATYPDTGVVRFTSVFGVGEVSFGAYTSVPLSEIGLFTQGIDTLPAGTQTPPILYGALPVTKYMVAYNTFDTLSKTSAFVLQVDWELRFS